ncbi:MAG: Na+/H+ antiporter subunit E [Oscillospiraceae bacterium]|nr:Na+/H+ antiporter subunit E [Oscillospiraceae bacterium]
MLLFLYLIWLCLNGGLTLEICLLGLGLIALLALPAWVLFGYGLRSELRFWRRLPFFLAFVVVMIWKILLANLDVLQIILNREKKIHPVLVHCHTSLKTEFCRFLLANSITLTPGTITVSMQDDLLTVHCLSKDMLEDTENGVIVRLLQRLEA